MNIAKLKKLSVVIICIVFIGYLPERNGREPAEQLDYAICTGYDIIPINEKSVKYEVDGVFYIFKENNKISSRIIGSESKSLAGNRENRQLKADKEISQGQLKVIIISENYARHGIRTIIDSLFKNIQVNDTAVFAIYKGKPIDIFNYKVKGYNSSIDFVEGLILNHRGYDFFPLEYSAIDNFVRMDSEGRNISIPCIEITTDGIELSGMALFKKDKLEAITDMENTRIMNMLTYNNVRGIITLFKGDNKHIDCYAKASRKVKCYKDKDKYRFLINLNLQADIIDDSIDDNPISKIAQQKYFEDLMADTVKKQCLAFINKMKNEYKVDCLELGRVAAATYGRRTGVDWNSIVMDSPIDINVNVKFGKQGRGRY